MSSSCNKIHFCPTIKNGLRASGKPREKEVRAMDRRWEERNRTKKEEKRWGLPCFCTIGSFPSSLWIMVNSLSQLAWCMHSIAHCLSAIKVWFSLSIIIWKDQSLAPSSAQNIESCVCLALELKQQLKIQTILIFITFFCDTFYCVWDRLMKVLSLCDALF